jgi:hypothetical protein
VQFNTQPPMCPFAPKAWIGLLELTKTPYERQEIPTVNPPGFSHAQSQGRHCPPRCWFRRINNNNNHNGGSSHRRVDGLTDDKLDHLFYNYDIADDEYLVVRE